MTRSIVMAVFTAVLLACTPIFSGAVMNAYPLHSAAGNDDVAAIGQLYRAAQKQTHVIARVRPRCLLPPGRTRCALRKR